jgi:hypothetical protein
MTQSFQGVLLGNRLKAHCSITVDSDHAEYMSDRDVTPPLPGGEYDLEVNGVHKRAVRTNGSWAAFEY